MQFVQTPRASSKIRQWFSRERRVDAIDQGRDDLVKAMRREALPVQKLFGSPMLTTVAEQLHYADLEGLYVGDRRGPRVGQGRRAADPARAARRRGTAADHRRPPAAARGPPPHRRGRARRGSRRRHGPAVALLHAGARRRDHGLRHPWPRRVGAPHRLRQRGEPAQPGRPRHRRRVGQRRARQLHGLGRGRGARPFEAPARHRRRAVGAPREHPLVHVADPDRPHRPAAVRVRARRSRPPRLDPRRGQTGRFGIRSRTRAARRNKT